MSVVTEPIILDETGQDIVTQLQAIVAGLAPNAGQISYSNATSGLSAEDVQEALDEIDGNVDTVSNSLTQLDTSLTSKTVTHTMTVAISAGGNELVNVDITNAPSTQHIIEGFRAQSGGAGSVVFSNIYFSDNNTITARLLNLGTSATTTAMKLTFDYK